MRCSCGGFSCDAPHTRSCDKHLQPTYNEAWHTIIPIRITQKYGQFCCHSKTMIKPKHFSNKKLDWLQTNMNWRMHFAAQSVRIVGHTAFHWKENKWSSGVWKGADGHNKYVHRSEYSAQWLSSEPWVCVPNKHRHFSPSQPHGLRTRPSVSCVFSPHSICSVHELWPDGNSLLFDHAHTRYVPCLLGWWTESFSADARLPLQCVASMRVAILPASVSSIWSVSVWTFRPDYHANPESIFNFNESIWPLRPTARS